jgi:hypothetical protein
MIERMRAALPKDARDKSRQTWGYIFARHGASPGLKTSLVKRPDIQLVTFDRVARDPKARPVRTL